jgi:hypothetical protein
VLSARAWRGGRGENPRAWLAVWTGWTALALFFAASNSLTYRSTGRPANWALTIKRSLSEWWLWAALTPVVFWLARRFPLHGARLWPHVAIHVVAGAILAVGQDRRGSHPLRAAHRRLDVLAGQHAGAQLRALRRDRGRRARGRILPPQPRARAPRGRLAETRLQLLGMQLQPHFLFNTLNTIAEMVHEDPDTADTMIAGLSGLLRRTLDLGSSQEIPLAEEIDLMSRYVEIQKARFGERLRVTVSVSEAAQDARVPALLLQPIVENAIRHGLAARLDAGRIDVNARVEGDALVIDVVDDGSGDAASLNGTERVGIGNTRARLEAMYGGRASLTLAPAEGRGARVTIRILR